MWAQGRAAAALGQPDLQQRFEDCRVGTMPARRIAHLAHHTIFTPEPMTYTAASAHDGDWIVLDRDLLPLMREALELAWSKGFLTGSRQLADYSIGGMNLGWELPGTFDVELEIRNLSLKLTAK